MNRMGNTLEDGVGQAPGQAEPVVEHVVGLEVPGWQHGRVGCVLQHDGQAGNHVALCVGAHAVQGDIGSADC